MSGKTKAYFNHRAKEYAGRHQEFYQNSVEYLKKNFSLDYRFILLDIGCGNGTFIKTLLKQNPSCNCIGLDLSYEMVSLAKNNLKDFKVDLLTADIFNLPFRTSAKFHVIHADSVLHHITSRTRKKSMNLVYKLIALLTRHKAVNGIFIFQEWYFLSFLVPEASSFMIFYGLKLINFLNLDLSFSKEIRPGLDVNFYLPNKLSEILSKFGEPILVDRCAVDFPRTYRALMLKEKGHVTFVLKSSVT